MIILNSKYIAIASAPSLAKLAQAAPRQE